MTTEGAYQPLRDAAAALRSGVRLTDAAVEAVATWLDAEAVVIGEMEPFVNLLNAAVKHQSGVETYLTLGRNEDGSIAMHADTSQAAFAVAAAIAAVGKGDSSMGGSDA